MRLKRVASVLVLVALLAGGLFVFRGQLFSVVSGPYYLYVEQRGDSVSLAPGTHTTITYTVSFPDDSLGARVTAIGLIGGVDPDKCLSTLPYGSLGNYSLSRDDVVITPASGYALRCSLGRTMFNVFVPGNDIDPTKDFEIATGHTYKIVWDITVPASLGQAPVVVYKSGGSDPLCAASSRYDCLYENIARNIQVGNTFDFYADFATGSVANIPKFVAQFTYKIDWLKVTFKDNSTGPRPVQNFHWDWGDGTSRDCSGSDCAPEFTSGVLHTYVTNGTYAVSMTATDSTGAKATSTASITVKAEPVGCAADPSLPECQQPPPADSPPSSPGVDWTFVGILAIFGFLAAVFAVWAVVPRHRVVKILLALVFLVLFILQATGTIHLVA